jgi:transposase-like protein
MAHGIKTVLIKKNENLECNNNNNNSKNSNCNNISTSRSNLLVDNCCLNVNNMMLNQNQIETHTVSNTTINKSLNCGGATMSITKSVTTTSASAAAATFGTKLGSRRIFTPHFKLQVLESYRNDNDCKGNQRATARKYGIHRRQIQKWLQCENNLRSIIANNPQSGKNIIKNTGKPIISLATSTTSSSSLISSPQSLQSSSTAILPSRLRVVSTNTINHQNKNVLNENSMLQHNNSIEKDRDIGTNYSCFPLTHAMPYKSDTLSTKCLTSHLTTPPTSKYLYVDSATTSNQQAIEIDKSPVNYYYETTNYNNSYSYYEKNNDLPIDLSCNKANKQVDNSGIIVTPTPIYPNSEHIARTSSFSPSSSPPHFTDISNSFLKTTSNPIDLTVPSNANNSSISHKRKYDVEDSRNNEKKPIKLFKPYLEENFEEEEAAKRQNTDGDRNEDKQKFPIIWSNHSNIFQEQFLNASSSDYYAPTSPPSYYPYVLTPQMYYEPMVVAPVTPTSTLSSPTSANQSYHTLLPPLLPSQASPVSGYDSSTSSIYSFNDNEHESNSGAHSPLHSSGHYEASSPLSTASTIPASPENHVEHELSFENKVPSPSSSLYDLKFKLFALDCYYKDDSCNDVVDKCKLVANKLNINCKVVEKWLRQEKDLRNQQEQQQLNILA